MVICNIFSLRCCCCKQPCCLIVNLFPNSCAWAAKHLESGLPESMKPDLHPPAAPCDPSRPIKPKAQQSTDYCSETPDANWVKQWNDCFFNKLMRGHTLMCSSIRPYIHLCTYVTQGNVSTDLFIPIMDNVNLKQRQLLSPGHRLPV